MCHRGRTGGQRGRLAGRVARHRLSRCTRCGRSGARRRTRPRCWRNWCAATRWARPCGTRPRPAQGRIAPVASPDPRCAEAAAVPAGRALAVGRDAFSSAVTDAIEAHPLIRVVRDEVTRSPPGLVVVASGPADLRCAGGRDCRPGGRGAALLLRRHGAHRSGRLDRHADAFAPRAMSAARLTISTAR